MENNSIDNDIPVPENNVDIKMEDKAENKVEEETLTDEIKMEDNAEDKVKEETLADQIKMEDNAEDKVKEETLADQIKMEDNAEDKVKEETLADETTAEMVPQAPATRYDKVTTFKLFVRNIAPGTEAAELKSVFETCGKVVECGISRNLGFVVSFLLTS